MANKVNTKTTNKSLFKMVPKADRDKAQQMLEAPANPGLNVDFNVDRLLNRKDVEYLGNVLNVIYPKSRYTPTQLNTTNQDLISTGTFIKYSPRDEAHLKAASVMACVMREYRNSYKIFINEYVENEAYDSVDLHEKGHVLFNHTQGYQMYIDQFRQLLDQVWDLKLAKYFEGSAFKNSKEKIVKLLFNEFSNIAQDMEINSKLFDNGEWVKAKKTMARSGIILTYTELLNKFDDLSGLVLNQSDRKFESKNYKVLVNKYKFLVENITNRIKGEEGDFQFCYPENKGWPCKLDWMTYMVLLVKDLDDTMQQVMKNIMEKLGAQGTGSGQGNGAGAGQPGGTGGKPISQDVLDQYDQQQSDEDNAQDAANGDGMDGDDDEFEQAMAAASAANSRNAGGTGRGSGSGGVQVEFETCEKFVDFTKFLRRECLGKKNRKWNSDVLYNSNRGKFSSSVVVPRRHLIEKWMPTECHILIDVSGSVPTDYVERVVNAIVDTNSGIDLKNSHIIFCDTRVVSDEIMSARTKEIYAGGGTEIAEGIKYVGKKRYLKKATDKLFIVSDLEDSLNDWVKAAEQIPGMKYVIGYNVHSDDDCNRLFEYGSRRSDDSSEFKKAWNRTFTKTIFITENIRG